MRALIAIALPVFIVGGASAQQQLTLPPPKTGSLPNLTRVMVPETRALALGEAQSLLAFVHDAKHADAHVSLVKLDANGNPAPYAVSWKIPHLPAFVKNPNYAVSVAFHPKLPLLYVWQDLALINAPPPNPEPPDLVNFNHLHIYNVGPAFMSAAPDKTGLFKPPELVASLCRAMPYLYGFAGGQIAVDPSGEFLYVPNLRDTKNLWILRLGRFKLDADGLPFLSDADAKLPLPARAKRVQDLNPAPHQIAPWDYVYLFPMNAWGAGHSFVPLGKDAALTSSYYGVASWRPNDKTYEMFGLPLRSNAQHLLAAHPTLPAVFATAADTDSFSRFEQSDGFVTGLPRQYKLEGDKLFSTPAVLPKSKQLAIGSHHAIILFELDELGYPKLEATRVPVFNPAVRCVAYSQKFDRLYVGVELSK